MEVGDFVKIVSSNLKGQIVQIKGKQAILELEDGLEYPTLLSDLAPYNQSEDRILEQVGKRGGAKNSENGGNRQRRNSKGTTSIRTNSKGTTTQAANSNWTTTKVTTTNWTTTKGTTTKGTTTRHTDIRHNTLEIDLHADKLGIVQDGPDTLRKQMCKVESTMQQYCHNKGLHIVFIHGVGMGILKQALWEFISTNYPKCGIEPATNIKYLNGATLVIVR